MPYRLSPNQPGDGAAAARSAQYLGKRLESARIDGAPHRPDHDVDARVEEGGGTIGER